MSLRNICIWLTTFSMLLWSINLLTPHYAVPTSLEAWMLDVGQGESILIREPGGKLLLFDGGPDNRVLSQLGAVLPPWQHYLDSRPHSRSSTIQDRCSLGLRIYLWHR
jgi:hypothetical protein